MQVKRNCNWNACVMVLLVIVIVNSRFLERPQKRSRRNQLIHRRLTKTKSIVSNSTALSHVGIGRQVGKYYVHGLFGWCIAW